MTLDKIEICQDDLEVKRLLVQHGKQTHIGVPEQHGFSGAFRSHVAWADGEYVYCVTHYHGYLLPSDNGYVAIKMPVDCGTTEEISEVIRMFIEQGMDASGPYYSDIVRDEVEAN